MAKNIKSQSRKTIKKVKTSVFERGLSLAKLGVQAGMGYATHKITGSNQDIFLIQQAQSIAKEFGKLKGSIMKAGQMLSLYGEYFLPPQANLFLKKLQSDSDPIEWETIEKYLQKYLGPKSLKELEIDPVPIGTASIGQVHKARIKKTGQQIAIKVQYPNLAKAIDSDLKSLDRILSLSRLIPKNMDLKAVLNEVKHMLKQELDYIAEAEKTQFYFNLLNEDHRYIVPQVIHQYSNKHVLTTEYIEGHRPDDEEVKSLPQDRRDQLSKNFLELFFNEIFKWSFVQTDPHLGNYKILIDPKGKQDQLVLLDFGASQEFDEQFMSKYKRFIKSSILHDDDNFMQAARELGFIIDRDTENYITEFKRLCYEIVEPFHQEDGFYNWKQSDLLGRVFKQALKFKNFDLRTPPKHLLFLDRKTAGVYIFLSVLDAQVNARKIVEPFLTEV